MEAQTLRHASREDYEESPMDIETVTGRFREGRPDRVVWPVSPPGRARPGGAASRARQVTMRNRISALSRADPPIWRASRRPATGGCSSQIRLICELTSRSAGPPDADSGHARQQRPAPSPDRGNPSQKVWNQLRITVT